MASKIPMTPAEQISDLKSLAEVTARVLSELGGLLSDAEPLVSTGRIPEPAAFAHKLHQLLIDDREELERLLGRVEHLLEPRGQVMVPFPDGEEARPSAPRAAADILAALAEKMEIDLEKVKALVLESEEWAQYWVDRFEKSGLRQWSNCSNLLGLVKRSREGITPAIARLQQIQERQSASMPMGFLGIAELGEALGVHPSQRGAFEKKLERERAGLGRDSWIEVQDSKLKYLYRADSPAVAALAEPYLRPFRA